MSDTEDDRRALAEVPPLPRRDSIESNLPVVDSTKLSPRQIYENKIAIGASLIPMSILGTLIRVGLQRLETYNGAPVFGLVYAQWIGCFIMGIAVQDKSILIHYYLPLQVALSTGLCGSITTFSSWQRDLFEAFANYDAANHNGGYNILAAISQFLVTIAMSFNGLVFGFHAGRVLATRFHTYKHRRVEIVAREFSMGSLTVRDWFVISFGYLTWIGVIFAATFTTTQRDLAMACVFAPVGALARWHLSVLNTCNQHFFLGTFAANMIGTAILAALSLVESGVVISSITCDVIKGLADGLCGCLTTISTFVVELSNLPLRHSYVYGMSSVILGQCLMFVIFGPYIWTQGVNPTC
ncbi:CrcB-like protein-domain-containing protein [Syncephalastrum racemosum]|uniref:CrcB-like protein-domain-containing protein n=1 Tax=Syncephalastrum racemosum TaxID=13706 RepID=A0A1X2HPB8_SYNRA|nr:CrcB-like protein-domain-containing protein [Syncephalastrum racemosum]